MKYVIFSSALGIGSARAQDTEDTGHRGQMSAEPMSGSNPDEMDGEGAAFAKRRQLPRRKSQMASRGMEEEKCGAYAPRQGRNPR